LFVLSGIQPVGCKIIHSNFIVNERVLLGKRTRSAYKVLVTLNEGDCQEYLCVNWRNPSKWLLEK
jgi:hypothetical protein